MSKYRFLNATATTFTFERSKFNLKHYLAEQHFGFGNGKKIRLTFRIGKPYGFHLTETPLSIHRSRNHRRRRNLFSSCDGGGKWDTELVDAKFGEEIEEVGREYINRIIFNHFHWKMKGIFCVFFHRFLNEYTHCCFSFTAKTNKSD